MNVLKQINGHFVLYPSLEDKPYPYYVRLTPSLSENNRARVKIFLKKGWKRVAIVTDASQALLFDVRKFSYFIYT